MTVKVYSGLIIYCLLAAERDPVNAVQKVAAILARDLMDNVATHMASPEGRARYGNLELPVLLGSESLSEDFERAVPLYYETLLVTVDFSGDVELFN